MSHMAEAQIKAGVIFGDNLSAEYVYMPGSEIGSACPLCVYETPAERRDIDIKEALRLIRVRSLRPCKHPRLGDNSC